MADDKLKTGLEEQQVPESPGPAEPGGSPTPEQPAPEHPGPEAPQEENTPAAPSGKVIDLTEARAAGEKTAEGPAVEEGSPKHGDEAFRDLFGNEEKPPWEKSLDEIKEEENAQKRRGRPKKAKDKVEPNKPEKGPGTRKGRPAKADKAALDKSPAPGVLDKVSRGGKKDKDKETGSGGDWARRESSKRQGRPCQGGGGAAPGDQAAAYAGSPAPPGGRGKNRLSENGGASPVPYIPGAPLQGTGR